jgi:hypothetical protein
MQQAPSLGNNSDHGSPSDRSRIGNTPTILRRRPVERETVAGPSSTVSQGDSTIKLSSQEVPHEPEPSKVSPSLPTPGGLKEAGAFWTTSKARSRSAPEQQSPQGAGLRFQASTEQSNPLRNRTNAAVHTSPGSMATNRDCQTTSPNRVEGRPSVDYQPKTNRVLARLNGFVSRSTTPPEAIDRKGKGKAKAEEPLLDQEWIGEEQGDAGESIGTSRAQNFHARHPVQS